jgi:hypothetical protein
MFPLALATAVPQIGLGALETANSLKGLKNLQGKPMPAYTMSPEYQQYYDTTRQRSQYGFDPTERANFNQNISQQQNTGYRQAVNQSGGNLAQAISVGLGAQNLGAQNQFAAQDASQHRQNIEQWGGAANQMQQQENLINQQKIQYRTQLEQAYGGALKSGLQNITNGLMGGIGLGSMIQGQDNGTAPASGNSAGISRMPNLGTPEYNLGFWNKGLGQSSNSQIPVNNMPDVGQPGYMPSDWSWNPGFGQMIHKNDPRLQLPANSNYGL